MNGDEMKSIETKFAIILERLSVLKLSSDSMHIRLDAVKTDTDINTKFRDDAKSKIEKIPKEFPCTLNDKNNPLIRLGRLEVLLSIAVLSFIFKILRLY